jgi:GNAT superfamily N-acetyltransferase
MEPVIRPFGERDVEFALLLSLRVGWTTSRAWYDAIVAHNRAGCFVIELSGGRAGVVTTTAYARGGWIGNLLVAPDLRRQGLGTALMTHAVAHLRAAGLRTFWLDADPPGINIYRSLGFQTQHPSLRFLRQGPGTVPATRATRLTASRLPELLALDAEAFGDDRRHLLAQVLARADTAFVLDDDDGPRGYCALLPTMTGLHLGPCVARDADTARQLLGAALGHAAGRMLTAGVPGPNKEAVKLFTALGFSPAASSERMRLGEAGTEGRADLTFAMGNGGTG